MPIFIDTVSGKPVSFTQDSVTGLLLQDAKSTQSSLNKTLAGEKLFGTPFIAKVKMTTGGGGGANTVSIFNANCPFPVMVIDCWTIQNAAGGAGDTFKLTDGTNDILPTPFMDCNKTDTTVTRANLIDDARYVIPTGGTLNAVTASDAPVDAYVLLLPVPN